MFETAILAVAEVPDVFKNHELPALGLKGRLRNIVEQEFLEFSSIHVP